jgi:N-acetylmuramic acid 6-phosphate etherase
MPEPTNQRGYLTTEQVNQRSQNLDRLSPIELVDLFNTEDQQTIKAIAGAREELAKVIEATATGMRQGGRLFYIGAGTSGRLGVLDAAECPPTFCTPPEMVQGILAGGDGALVRSSEGLEDIAADGAQAMIDRAVGNHDVLVGIAAGGTTPYVHGALQAAKELGATTAFIACVPLDQVPAKADIEIRLLVGPEILTGSTRLKSGTVTKMALNIISTGAMVQLGKVYGNRMVDVAVTNDKLHDRAIRMLADLAEIDYTAATKLLAEADKSVKVALLMHWTGVDRAKAKQLLEEQQGQLRAAKAAASLPS